MKKNFSSVCGWVMAMGSMLLVGPGAQAQAPVWQTAVGLGAAARVLATAVDGSGAVYVAGYFTGILTLGSINLTSAGSQDGFVAKWSPTGGFVWAQRVGGSTGDQIRAVAVSGGGVYVAGYYSGTAASFGSLALPGYGNTAAFVAKLTDTGSSTGFVWAQAIGGSNPSSISGTTATALGVRGSNLYVAGYFQGTVSIGANSYTSTSNGNDDTFVTRLTDAGLTGSVGWTATGGGTDSDRATALAVPDTGTAVYVGGTFAYAASFGSSTLTSAGVRDAFVARLDDNGPAGSYAWVARAGGPGNDQASALAVSGTALYAAGYFAGNAGFGATTLTATAMRNTFVTRLNPSSGTYNWAVQAGGTGGGNDEATALAAAGSSVYVGGYYNSPSTFGSTTLSLVGLANGYLARLADSGTAGTFAWATHTTGDAQVVNALVVTNGRVYAAGYFLGSASFDTLTLPGSGAGVENGFLASLTDATLTATTATLRPESIGLYPNPAHGRATVQLPAGSGPATLTLLDALGRTLRIQTATTELDLTGLVPGLYAVRVAAGGGTATRRLVVE